MDKNFVSEFINLNKPLSILRLLETRTPWAVPNNDNDAIKRESEEEGKIDEDDHRNSFQHDIGRIIHCKAFRRLKHKTQVFISYEEDHFRTRLTHTLEVAQLGTSSARTLGLNEDLTLAIALGHDLGHTPFGHAGESVLNEAMRRKRSGGFKHNIQSLRIVDNLDETYKELYKNDFPGLNLTREVREGILKHTNVPKDYNVENNLNPKQHSALEGQLIEMCDEISQRCHDLDDGVRSKIIDFDWICNVFKKNLNCYCEEILADAEEIKARKKSEKYYMPIFRRKLIHFFMTNLIKESRKIIAEQYVKRPKGFDYKYFKRAKEKTIRFNQDVAKFFKDLYSDFLFPEVYNSREMNYRDKRAEHFITSLFDVYFSNPMVLHNETLEKLNKLNIISKSKINDIKKYRQPDNEKEYKKILSKLQKDRHFNRLICDHIAGMTDTYAQREYERFYEPFVAYME
jgi:dGTPase